MDDVYSWFMRYDHYNKIEFAQLDVHGLNYLSLNLSYTRPCIVNLSSTVCLILSASFVPTSIVANFAASRITDKLYSKYLWKYVLREQCHGWLTTSREFTTSNFGIENHGSLFNLPENSQNYLLSIPTAKKANCPITASNLISY